MGREKERERGERERERWGNHIERLHKVKRQKAKKS